MSEVRKVIEVLVVDDSALVRETFRALLRNDVRFQVDTAADVSIAKQKMSRSVPSVLVLDIELPGIDGLTFLRQLMESTPLPVVVCSSHASKGSAVAMRALSEGAVDVIEKPRIGVRDFLVETAAMVTDALVAASEARISRASSLRPVAVKSAPPMRAIPSAGVRDRIIAIGASTGGTEAIAQILTAMPADAPPIVIVQHMPEAFTTSFARHLDGICAISVAEAKSGEALRAGRALIAPGNRHVVVRRALSGYSVLLNAEPPVSRHRPSVDVLFRSVARAAADDSVGVILSGMGNDGAAGMSDMRVAGAITIAQDEESCVVFGMPKEAIARGGVQYVASLDAIAAMALQAARGSRDAAASLRPALR